MHRKERILQAHEFLQQYGTVTKEIAFKKSCMLRAEKDAVHGGKAEKWASDYQDRLYAETEELIRLRFMIENAVEKCPCSQTERQVLYKRYIEGRKWTEIASEMLYSVQHLHRLKESALLKLCVPREFKI